ncbi:hypothetical protein NL676_029961 [Syzygium grande]|nr:hypothetical protein NL676_029961 [Syzygium grande]
MHGSWLCIVLVHHSWPNIVLVHRARESFMAVHRAHMCGASLWPKDRGRDTSCPLRRSWRPCIVPVCAAEPFMAYALPVRRRASLHGRVSGRGIAPLRHSWLSIMPLHRSWPQGRAHASPFMAKCRARASCRASFMAKHRGCIARGRGVVVVHRSCASLMVGIEPAASLMAESRRARSMVQGRTSCSCIVPCIVHGRALWPCVVPVHGRALCPCIIHG